MYNWSGSLAQYASTVVTLPSATLQSGTNTFNAVVSLPNGMSDEGNANNSVSSTMNIVTDGEIVQMTLNLDYYASETTWELRNQAGDILYAGGGYSDGSTTTVVSETFCLPAGCYTFKLMDEFGDGLTSNNYPSGSYSITNSSGTILASLSTQNANFGFMHESNFCVQTNNINELVEANKMQVYPNPSSDLMTVYSVEGAEIQSISLHDITGKKIFTHNEINSTSVQFSVENFSKGSYILEISSDKGLIRKSVIVK
jgi:lysyl endopeptidase